MIYLFCCFPLAENEPDPDYLAEWEAASFAGIESYLISFEALTMENKAERAIRNVPVFEEVKTALYRGWMLTPNQYETLYNALLAKNINLINNPAEYKHCHYLPESYRLIEDYTAKTTWYKVGGSRVNYDELMKMLSTFKGAPLIVKDYVKSAKHSWLDACYISDSSQMSEVTRVVDNFVELRGDSLNEGLVFREFLELEQVTEHSKSGMPLFLEYRLFYLQGKPVALIPYWEEGSYPEEEIPLERFNRIALTIESSFFAMDIARSVDGEWYIIELGDGQVSGLPERADVNNFIKGLAKAM